MNLRQYKRHLDNLCDRLSVTEPSAFRVLHYSFLDALNPNAPLRDYYELYPYSETIYLRTLVKTCQQILSTIPYYPVLQPLALQLGTYYCELQTLKHVPRGDKLLQAWAAQTFGSKLAWNEWAAASGSTLGLFFLFAVSFRPPPKDIDERIQAYFPWIQGFHILLDYLIDLEEDLKHGDLNFVSFYPSITARDAALQMFVKECRWQAKALSFSSFHQTVVDGLIALYGSDRKVQKQGLENVVKELANNTTTRKMLYLCTLLRRVGFVP